jgi:outer membrane protein assembly factor BamD (BamD/ComL family)
MHKPADARSSFSQVVAQYPSSAFSTAAKNFLLEMDSQGK